MLLYSDSKPNTLADATRLRLLLLGRELLETYRVYSKYIDDAFSAQFNRVKIIELAVSMSTGSKPGWQGMFHIGLMNNFIIFLIKP